MKPANLSMVSISPVSIGLMVDGYFLTPSGKQYNYLYFAHQISYLKKNYLLAFCVDKNAIQTAGIITLYKIKNQDKS